MPKHAINNTGIAITTTRAIGTILLIQRNSSQCKYANFMKQRIYPVYCNGELFGEKVLDFFVSFKTQLCCPLFYQFRTVDGLNAKIHLAERPYTEEKFMAIFTFGCFPES